MNLTTFVNSLNPDAFGALWNACINRQQTICNVLTKEERILAKYNRFKAIQSVRKRTGLTAFQARDIVNREILCSEPKPDDPKVTIVRYPDNYEANE